MNEEKTKQRKSQIIEATFRCIAEKGYENLTMNLISEYAQMSKGSIAYYFKTKEDVLMSVLKELDRKLFTAVDARISDNLNVEDHLLQRFIGSFEMVREDRTLFYVLIDFFSLAINRNKFKQEIRRFLRKYRKLSAVGTIPGTKASLYKEVNQKNLGAVMMGMFIGLAIQWILDEDDVQFDDTRLIAQEMVVTYLEKGSPISFSKDNF
jgi:AcrR family transcriptional regulator